MRISDWSSDVCSSDLTAFEANHPGLARIAGSCESVLNRRPCLESPDFGYETAWKRRWLAAVAVAVDMGIVDLDVGQPLATPENRSEEHTSELQSLMRISYAVLCLKKKNTKRKMTTKNHSV